MINVVTSRGLEWPMPLTLGLQLKYRISLGSVLLGGIKLNTDSAQSGLDFASDNTSITIVALQPLQSWSNVKTSTDSDTSASAVARKLLEKTRSGVYTIGNEKYSVLI